MKPNLDKNPLLEDKKLIIHLQLSLKQDPGSDLNNMVLSRMRLEQKKRPLRRQHLAIPLIIMSFLGSILIFSIIFQMIGWTVLSEQLTKVNLELTERITSSNLWYSLSILFLLGLIQLLIYLESRSDKKLTFTD